MTQLGVTADTDQSDLPDNVTLSQSDENSTNVTQKPVAGPGKYGHVTVDEDGNVSVVTNLGKGRRRDHSTSVIKKGENKFKAVITVNIHPDDAKKIGLVKIGCQQCGGSLDRSETGSLICHFCGQEYLVVESKNATKIQQHVKGGEGPLFMVAAQGGLSDGDTHIDQTVTDHNGPSVMLGYVKGEVNSPKAGDQVKSRSRVVYDDVADQSGDSSIVIDGNVRGGFVNLGGGDVIIGGKRVKEGVYGGRVGKKSADSVDILGRSITPEQKNFKNLVRGAIKAISNMWLDSNATLRPMFEEQGEQFQQFVKEQVNVLRRFMGVRDDEIDPNRGLIEVREIVESLETKQKEYNLDQYPIN